MSPSRSIQATNQADDDWICPLEMVLGLTSSWFKSTIWQRCERGDVPDRHVRVFAQQDRLYATIRWLEGNHQPLTVALDVFMLPAPTPKVAS